MTLPPAAGLPAGVDKRLYYGYNTVGNRIIDVVQFGEGVTAVVSFDGLRLEEGSPIYLQIIRCLERGIAAGAVADGDELPSRRVLSARLGVNPNTIQKAFRLLEEEGLISSRAGAKSAVTLTPERAAAIRRRLLEEEAAALVRSLRQLGLDREGAAALVLRLWDGETEREEEAP